jgi:hypothetical protein
MKSDLKLSSSITFKRETEIDGETIRVDKIRRDVRRRSVAEQFDPVVLVKDVVLSKKRYKKKKVGFTHYESA